jgi:hypothetical protein
MLSAACAQISAKPVSGPTRFPVLWQLKCGGVRVIRAARASSARKNENFTRWKEVQLVVPPTIKVANPEVNLSSNEFIHSGHGFNFRLGCCSSPRSR